MPAKDFSERNGHYPRNGQWVLVDGNKSAEIKALAKLGLVEAGTTGKFVGIFGGVDEPRRVDHVQDGSTIIVSPPNLQRSRRSNNVIVHLVGPAGENLPGCSVAVTLDDITPVLHRAQVPKARLLLMDPSWQPSP